MIVSGRRYDDLGFLRKPRCHRNLSRGHREEGHTAKRLCQIVLPGGVQCALSRGRSLFDIRQLVHQSARDGV